jgi:hypothetical protein
VADLSKVTIGIKSFLRKDKLHNAIAGIQQNLPECWLTVADDSEDAYKRVLVAGNSTVRETLIRCPFDSGFGFKSNLIAQYCQTPYLLIGSDDFDFSTKAVRTGIEKLVDVLDSNPGVHVAGGRVNNRRYEFNFVINGTEITEERVEPLPDFVFCDLTVNYCLVRKEVFSKVQWDDDVKIGGGEHAAWFLDIKRNGFNTVYVSGVNITAQPGHDSPEYRIYRNRASSPERPCLYRRGITKYTLGDGRIDYELTDSSKKL